ncbi:UPF0481 protein At3g47200-like [Macadamia integrifolia]|uniref:UPF0481 protein At3g47200-like n=1 Tax=Macadamia integrifolia TaxID=60698 RepID=UPI001C4E6E2A|nr:UPF0481 protein At3g47200-like [Macadamia integrifolia]
MRESSSINIELITNKLPVPRSSNASIGPTHCIYRADERIRKMPTRRILSPLALIILRSETCKCKPWKTLSRNTLRHFLFEPVAEPDDDDPIFSSILRRTRVVRDLALLENQIPMSVLQRLFDLNGMYMYPEHPEAINTHKHLLDLLNNTFDGSLPAIASPELIEPLEYLPCVMELMRSGVKFEKRDPDYLMNIEFNKGTFRIPPLCVNDYTDSFFRNLMAYEQQRSGTTGRYYVTSYVLLMDSLIDSADDVKFLRGSEIIVNLLGDDSKVSSLFNNLCNGISTKKSCYGDLYYRVREYYNRPCNKWKATFRRDYCNSPWTIISVGAAILLLFLTIWATIFTTLPVFNVNFKH